MKIEAKKVVTVHAEVTFNGWDYKVTPNGDVYIWTFDDEYADGDWVWMSDCEYNYDKIKAAGLAVLDIED